MTSFSSQMFGTMGVTFALPAACMIQPNSRSTGVTAAKATRAKAKQLRYAAPREMCRLLRVAEEYDKLGERYAAWQGSAQLPAAEAPEQ